MRSRRIEHLNRELAVFTILVLVPAIAGCSRSGSPASPVAPDAVRSIVQPSAAPAGVSTFSCAYSGASHALLAPTFRSIGLTLCATHFPEGSAARAAVGVAIAHLDQISNSSLYFYIKGTAPHTEYGDTFKHDGVNKLDFVDPDDCDCSDTQFDGRTMTYGNAAGAIEEFDIGFNKYTDWNYGAPSSWDLSDGTTYFRTDLLHELGHGIGFDHTEKVVNVLSIMGSYTGKWVGMQRVGWKAYDYGHLRYHYGDHTDQSRPDLVLSNYWTYWNGTSYPCDLTMGLSSTTAYRGQTITLVWTRMNLGDASVVDDYHTRVYLTTSSDGSTTYRTLKRWVYLSPVSPHSTLYCSTQLTIPSDLPTGTYYVAIEIDCDNEIAEDKEDNNVLVIHDTLTIR